MKIHKLHFSKIHYKVDKKKLLKFFLVLALIVVWSFALLVIGPVQLLEFFGTSNSYLILFLVGALGGVSTLTATFFYSTLISLVYAGLNPLTLGIIGGVAITIGDSLFFYLGRSGREALYGEVRKVTARLSHWLTSLPSWLVPVVTFAYVGLTPLPNDVLTVSLGLAGIRYRNVILAILLGNIFLTIVTAYIALNGFFFFF